MTQALHPNPKVWPECSTCETAWVLRRCFSFAEPRGYVWLWQRDCKHKSDPAVRDERKKKA